MIYALKTDTLGKRYGKSWAVRNCSLQIPQGAVAGLVGLNGAGKTTLLHLATGLLKPDEGTITVLDKSLEKLAAISPSIGFVAQERSLYRSFTVNETLTFGKKLNPHWDDAYAHTLTERLQLPRKRQVGKLSGGQQAQLALLMALAKKPALLLLDEPFANIDPLMKRELSKILMEAAVERPMTMLVSSHSVSDLEAICDYLIILSSSQVKLSEEVDHMKEQHKLLIGPAEHFDSLANTYTVLQASHTGRQSTALVRTTLPVTIPNWQVQDVSLEDIVLAYLASQPRPDIQQPSTVLMKEVL